MGLGIMMIEHDMEMVMKLTDYITVINFEKRFSRWAWFLFKMTQE